MQTTATSVVSGTFIPLIQSSSSTNLPSVGSSPYLRLTEANPQQYAAVDMSGNPVANFSLPQNTTTSSLIPTVETSNGRTIVGVEAIDVPRSKLIKVIPYQNNSLLGGGSFSILATANTLSGTPISMGVAAADLGYDHFNYIQIIKGDTALVACAGNPALPGCAGALTVAGTVPKLPTADPPPGGYAYEGASPGHPA